MITLYETVEIARPGDQFKPVRALVVGPFAVHEDGGRVWMDPETEDDLGYWADTYGLTHVNTGYSLADCWTDHLTVCRVAHELADDPEIAAWFDNNDDSATTGTAIDPALKERMRAIIMAGRERDE